MAGMPPRAMRAQAVCIRYAVGYCSVRSGVPKASPGCQSIVEPGKMRKISRTNHVIARSEATWQSVFLWKGLLVGTWEGERIATPVCALARNDIVFLRFSSFQLLIRIKGEGFASAPRLSFCIQHSAFSISPIIPKRQGGCKYRPAFFRFSRRSPSGCSGTFSAWGSPPWCPPAGAADPSAPWSAWWESPLPR